MKSGLTPSEIHAYLGRPKQVRLAVASFLEWNALVSPTLSVVQLGTSPAIADVNLAIEQSPAFAVLSITPKLAGYAKFELTATDMSDTVTGTFELVVHQAYNHRIGCTKLLYINMLGGWDSLSFAGKNESLGGSENNAQLVFANQGLSTFQNELTKTATLFTDNIRLNEHQIIDLLQSPKVYLLEPKSVYDQNRKTLEAWQTLVTYDVQYVATEVYVPAQNAVYAKDGSQFSTFSVDISLPVQTPQRL